MSKATILRELAKGEECQVRLPGVCNRNPETTVLAHLPGAGVALKVHDLLGAHACSSCHDVLDGRIKSIFNKDYLEHAHLQAMKRTQLVLIERGYIQIVKAPQPRLQKILPREGFV